MSLIKKTICYLILFLLYVIIGFSMDTMLKVYVYMHVDKVYADENGKIITIWK